MLDSGRSMGTLCNFPQPRYWTLGLLPPSQSWMGFSRLTTGAIQNDPVAAGFQKPHPKRVNLKTLPWFCEPPKVITWLRFVMGISRNGNRDGSSQCSLHLCRAYRRCTENNIAHCKEMSRRDGPASSR